MPEEVRVCAHLRSLYYSDECPQCGEEIGVDGGNEFSEDLTKLVFTCEDCDIRWKRGVIPFKVGPREMLTDGDS
jgi:hypothetical protein